MQVEKQAQLAESAKPTIGTLVDDINNVLLEKVDADTLEKHLPEALMGLKELLQRRLVKGVEERNDALRMSNLGKPCRRQLWYLTNGYKQDELSPATLYKFLYGDIIEWLTLLLARVSGHHVTAEQQTVNIQGVPGHIDAIIDGHLVDVKSANSRSFDKFKYHKLETEDPFGYISQISTYAYALGKDEASFLAVDKELGNMVLDTYKLPAKDWDTEVNSIKNDMESPEPPPRCFEPVPHNKSGNMQLALECRYCPVKQHCYNFDTYLYSSGPVFMTKVVKEPEVPKV